ncbi:uncharacterized protein ACNLHF_012655 [Anomaloglossus baeobatrachus]
MDPRLALQKGRSTRAALSVLLILILCTKSVWSQATVTKTNDVVTFWYNSSTQVVTFTFDYCDIVKCQLGRVPQMGCQAHLRQGQQYICVTGGGYGDTCSSWKAVGWNTGENWGYKPSVALNKRDEKGRSLLTRMTLSRAPATRTCTTNNQCNPLVLNIEHPQSQDEGIYLLGTHIKGGHNGCMQLGKFRLSQMTKVLPVFRMLTHIQTFHSMVAIANPTMEDVYAVEQGYTDTNLWLEWMKYTVHQVNRSDCYVCAGARPHLGTVPLNLDYEAELCLVSLFTNMTEGNACEEWKKRYPIVAKAFSPGKGITIYPGNYTCYNVSGQGRDMGRFRDGFCGSYSNLTRDHLINQVQSVADVFWICGDMKIRSRVEGNWTGECTLAKALMPIHIAPADHTVKENDFIAHIKINLRTRRSADDDRTSRNTPKGSFDPHVYIDAIGVPRGVPDEYKARDQVRAGFESIIPIITVNKNVDWINYIYYNQQRFVNYTRDALQGLAEQLDPTSIMAYQNRMALDMILAEKGGVCKMVGDVCCTYIPDNTGVDGKVTLAIKKLTTLSEELKKNSGVTDPWGDYFGWTSSFKGWLIQIGTALSIVLVILLAILDPERSQKSDSNSKVSSSQHS